MDSNAATRRARWLMAAGMLAGLVAAAWTLLAGTAAGGLPDGAVARVNDRLILRADWQRAIAAVATDRRTPLTEADLRRILERLVDEELLVQHGLALGLVESDRRLRGMLVQDVMASATAHVAEPDEAELRRFYDDNLAWFTTAPRLRVAAIGAAVAPPDALLPPAKLREYLGPRLTDVALALEPGQARRLADGVEIRLLQKEPAHSPPFEQMREEIRTAWRRRAEEQAVAQLLAELRDDGRVVVVDGEP